MKRLRQGLLALVVLAGLGASLVYAQGTAFWPYSVAPTQDAAYDIGNTASRFRDVFQSGHVVNAGGTAPTCSAACGSTATVAGTDTAMVWSLTGASQANPLVITFNRAFVVAPACTAANQTTAANYVTKILTSTTTATVTLAAGPTANDKVSVICLGAGG